MMVTIEQVKDGIGRYIDAEFTARLQGFRKWIIPLGAAALVNQKLDAMLSGEGAEMVKSLGYMTEDRMIDIDRLYADMLSIARSKGSITEHFPILGDVTFSEADIESLRRHIS